MKTKQVWKWTLLARDLTSISMPRGGEFLTAREQRGNICVWALVDPEETRHEERTLRIAGTGHNLDNGRFNYIDTVFLEGGALVFHVFEVL